MFQKLLRSRMRDLPRMTFDTLKQRALTVQQKRCNGFFTADYEACS